MGVGDVRKPSAVEEQYFLLKETHCLGFNEHTHWTIETWKQDQELELYNAMNDLWLCFVSERAPWARYQFSNEQWNMWYMACYSIDSFRRFVFQSTFLRSIDLKEDELVRLQSSDEALMQFAFRWLSFCLFGERSVSLRGNRCSIPR